MSSGENLESDDLLGKATLEPTNIREILPQYDDQINEQIVLKNGLSIEVDWNSLPLDIRETFYVDPEKFLAEANDELVNRFNIVNHEIYKQFSYRSSNYAIRWKNLPKTYTLRELDTELLKKFIEVTGIVIRSSRVMPMIKTGVFRCILCGEDGGEYKVPQTEFNLTYPKRCEGIVKISGAVVGCRGRWELLPDKSEYENTQLYVLQENPEDGDASGSPTRMNLRIPSHLINFARAGDRVNVYGVLKPVIEKKNSRICGLTLLVNNVEVLGEELRNPKIGESDLAEISALSQDIKLKEKVTNSIAPSIYGYEDIKYSLALLLVGGVRKTLADNAKIRGDINILLIGDPSVSKSQLLKYVQSVSPRGVYSAGRGASGVGLTAALVKESESGEFVLEAGALVLADGGIACVDEAEKIRNEDRDFIHEALAQQTVSINKGGINATLNARCAVLMAANPRDGRYNEFRSIRENIPFPASLLTRFDLIWVIRDNPSVDLDSKISSHILRTQSGVETVKSPINQELLKKYVAVARKTGTVIPVEVLDSIQAFYLGMRNQSSERSKDAPMSITARQLETVIRLTEASAKLRLCSEANMDDVLNAINLLNSSLTQIGFDAVSGGIDIDAAEGRVPRSEVGKRNLVLSVVKKLTFDAFPRINFVHVNDVAAQVAVESDNLINTEETVRLLEGLHSVGSVINVRANCWGLP